MVLFLLYQLLGSHLVLLHYYCVARVDVILCLQCCVPLLYFVLNFTFHIVLYFAFAFYWSLTVDGGHNVHNFEWSVTSLIVKKRYHPGVSSVYVIVDYHWISLSERSTFVIAFKKLQLLYIYTHVTCIKTWFCLLLVWT